MTDRCRRSTDDDRSRAQPPDDRRQNRATPAREERSLGPDGGLDSGRGFGRIGVPPSDPWAGESGSKEATGLGPSADGRGRRRSGP
jgi:hypothetical protein